MKQRIYFIINPTSGGNKRLQKRLPQWIERYLSGQFSYEIHYTEYAGHARELAREVVNRGDVDILAVAGGDGSINEVLPVIIHTEVALAILPVGSGNGLARHLGYPMNVRKVLRNFNRASMDQVDVGQSGELLFSSNAGAGFDGFVAKSFSRQGKRGFWGYAISVVKHVFVYEPFPYQLKCGDATIEGQAFMITFFNSNQYGFNVKMAKGASVKDGLLEAYIVNHFPKWMAAFYAIAVFFGWHKRYKRIQHFTGKHFTLKMNQPVDFHIDGEEIGKATDIEVESIPSSLKVLIPHGQKE